MNQIRNFTCDKTENATFFYRKEKKLEKASWLKILVARAQEAERA